MDKPVILILEAFFIDLFDCNLERLSSMLRCVDYTKLTRAENFVVEYLDEYLNSPALKNSFYLINLFYVGGTSFIRVERHNIAELLLRYGWVLLRDVWVRVHWP